MENPIEAHKLYFWLSILGGGIFAALVTFILGLWAENRKRKLDADQYLRRYAADQINAASAGLMDSFFGAKNVLEYLVGLLSADPAAAGHDKWIQYARDMQGFQSKAETHLQTLGLLVPPSIVQELEDVLRTLSERFDGNSANALRKLQLFKDLQPQVNAIRKELAQAVISELRGK